MRESSLCTPRRSRRPPALFAPGPRPARAQSAEKNTELPPHFLPKPVGMNHLAHSDRTQSTTSTDTVLFYAQNSIHEHVHTRSTRRALCQLGTKCPSPPPLVRLPIACSRVRSRTEWEGGATTPWCLQRPRRVVSEAEPAEKRGGRHGEQRRAQSTAAERGCSRVLRARNLLVLAGVASLALVASLAHGSEGASR